MELTIGGALYRWLMLLGSGGYSYDFRGYAYVFVKTEIFGF